MSLAEVPGVAREIKKFIENRTNPILKKKISEFGPAVWLTCKYICRREKIYYIDK